MAAAGRAAAALNGSEQEWPEAVKDEIRYLRAERPNPGKGKVHPLLSPVLRTAELVLPGGDHHRPTDRRRRRPARGSVAPGQPGPAQAPVTPEAVQAQGLPGAASRGGPGGGHRGRGARRGAALPVRLPRPAQPVRPGGGHAGVSSRWARDFADIAFDRFPGPVDRAPLRHGSEYEDQFADLLTARGIARYYAYPKTPNMNAYAGRFNRAPSRRSPRLPRGPALGRRGELGPAEPEVGGAAALVQRGAPDEALGQRTPIAALARERSTLDHLPRPLPPRVAELGHSPSTARPAGFLRRQMDSPRASG